MLRLMSLNLNYRVAKHGDWEARRRLIVQAVSRARPDVLALQAVEGTDGDNQAEELARALEYPHVAFVAAMTGHGRRRGSAFASRLPLLDLDVRKLSRQPDHEDASERVLLRAGIETAVGRLWLYNAHFSWVPAQALDNVREMLAFHNGMSAILLGDLNNAPDSPAVDGLREAGWMDLWAALRPDEAGCTFESDHPTLRIDYALATADLRAQADSIEIVTGGGARPPRLSDHLGLLVALRDEGRRGS